MRIVHVCITSNVFNKNYAYQENLLTKYHALLGHEVSIVAPIYLEFDKQTGCIICTNPGVEEINYGIKVYRLKPVLNPSIDRHIHWFRKFNTTIEALHPDFLFVHSVSSLNYRFFKKYKERHPNVRIVFDNHADRVNSCQNLLSKTYSRIIIRKFIIPRIVNVSNHFYGVTPARCDFLNEMYGIPNEKIFLLPLGADDEEIHLEKKEEIRREVRITYNISDDDFLIVTGGKIDPLKNIHSLAEAVRNCSDKRIKMLIFGSIRDDLKPTFERLISDRIQYIGWQPANEVYRYFHAADIVMFPGLHSVLWEQAVASQVPCAFSKIKGFEHIDIGGNCVMLENKTADYYKHVIESIYQDEVRYNAMKLAASSKKSLQFLYSHIAQKVIDDTI